jgi:hypothetical protein
MAADKWSDQIRACGLFFISIVVLMVIPLVYHCFVFLTALPLWGVNTASCIILLVGFHTLFLLLVVSYWKVIFTDAGGVPYELDEAWVSSGGLARAGAALLAARCMLLAAVAVWDAPSRALAAGPVEWEESECSCRRSQALQCSTSLRHKAIIMFLQRPPPGVCPPLAHVPADFRAELGAPLWPRGRGVGACF